MCNEPPKAIKEDSNINCFKMGDRQVFGKRNMGVEMLNQYKDVQKMPSYRGAVRFTAKS